MAEIRKHNPTTSDIGQQVRAQLGETIRPIPPGAPRRSSGAARRVDDDAMFDPFDAAERSVGDIDPDDEAYEQTHVLALKAGGDPVIGALPGNFGLEYDDPEE